MWRGAVLGLLLAMAALAPARASEHVTVRAAEHDKDGFGRIAFDWPAPVTFDAKIEGETLTVHFARPLEAKLDAVMRYLDGYVASARIDGDSLIAQLKRPATVRSFAEGNTVAVDIVTGKTAATKPVKPAKPAPMVAAAPAEAAPASPSSEPAAGVSPSAGSALAAPAPPSVALDVSEHDGSRRVVLDWHEPVHYLFHREPGAAEFRFAHPFTLDTERLAAALPGLSPRLAEEAGKTVLRFKLPPGTRFGSSHTPNSIILEVAGKPVPAKPASAPEAPAPSPVAAPMPAVTAPAPPSVALSFSEDDGRRRVVLDWHGPVHYLFHEAGRLVQFRFAHPFTLDAERLAAELPDLSPSLGDDAGKMVLRFELPAGTRLEAVHTASTIVIDVIGKHGLAPAVPPPGVANVPPPAAETTAAPSGVVPPPELVEPAAPPPEPAKPEHGSKRPTATLPPPAGAIPVHYVLAPQGASLRFDFANAPPAAVFRRGSGLWIVFSGAKLLDLSELRRAEGDVIARADQLPDAKATVLRLVTREGISPSVRRANEGWVVELKPEETRAAAPIALEARSSADAAEIFLAVHEAAEAVTLRDPEVGDELAVVPVGEVGRGIAETQSFVDFIALPSVQGIVLRPNADDLVLRRDDVGVTVARPGGLLLSQAWDRELAVEDRGPPRMLDFVAWRGPDRETFLEKRSELERRVAAAPTQLRTKPRLALAHFYFANLYAAEAEGVLEAIRRDDPAALADAPQQLLGAAVALLDGDPKAAGQLLAAESLAKQPEAQLWRGSLAAEAGDWPSAAQGFTAGASFLPRYPKTLRRRFALEAAEALIETGQAAEAQPLLQLVQKSEPTIHDQAEAAFLDGRRLLALGDEKQAIAVWDKVAAMDDRQARARASFAKVMAELQTKDISRADAIKALDRLRFAWRGDKLEFDLLRRLGELKLADGDPRGAFDTLREAAGDFPDDPQAKDVTKQLSDDVAELFLGHGLDDLPPLKALTLYDEFKDYLPVGDRGDAAVRRLVDRLVAVDLLDRAGSLLEELVVHRLAGKEKARAAGQLAVIRLLDNRPADALKALDIDVGKDMPADMMRQRQQLRARALTELNRSDEALAILASDNSRDADRLRADIFWRARNWTEAAKVFARLVPPPGAPSLDPTQAQLVLNWASALTLAGDQLSLSDLRSGYGKAMAATPLADAFHVIAEAPVAGGNDGDPRALANRVAQVGELQSFMAGLKEKVEKDKLSAVN
ncbi:MAG TPA: hypothetical protein VLX85_07505 [Stellaceae bacterium]|nr:hypothetical protein [Stellaceae bacterium]